MSGRLLLGLASFVAIFATAYLGFWFLVARFELIDNYNTLNILNFVRDIAAMTVIGLAGLAFFVRRRWFILLIYLALYIVLSTSNKYKSRLIFVSVGFYFMFFRYKVQ